MVCPVCGDTLLSPIINLKWCRSLGSSYLKYATAAIAFSEASEYMETLILSNQDKLVHPINTKVLQHVQRHSPVFPHSIGCLWKWIIPIAAIRTNLSQKNLPANDYRGQKNRWDQICHSIQIGGICEYRVFQQEAIWIESCYLSNPPKKPKLIFDSTMCSVAKRYISNSRTRQRDFVKVASGVINENWRTQMGTEPGFLWAASQ